MKHQSRFGIILISVFIALYLSFSLFTPLFHHHYEAIQDVNQIVYHSHLLNQTAQQRKSSNCNHSVGTIHNHNHITYLNTVINNLSMRCVNPSMNASLVNSNCCFDIKNAGCGSFFIESTYKWKDLKDKCIRTATNVSPPFVLAA